MTPPSPLRLPLDVDLEGLRAEVEALGPADWVGHFNVRQYRGDWSGAALRAVGGDALRLYPDLAHGRPYEDTPLLARCPKVRGLLDDLGCPTTAVRFLRLGPGAEVTEHRDDLGWEDGEVRLHVPVFTGPGVAFTVAGRQVQMAPGECWYADLTQPHAVVNGGTAARVHLVVDCVLDDALRARFVTASSRG